MNFPPRAGRVLRSGYALPPSRPARELQGPTPAAVHLAFAESCSDDRGQLFVVFYAIAATPGGGDGVG